MKVFSHGFWVGLVSFGVLALSLVESANSTPPRKRSMLEYTFNPLGKVESGVPVKFSLNYTQGMGYNATKVRFTLVGLDGLKNVEFIGSPALEWESTLENRK